MCVSFDCSSAVVMKRAKSTPAPNLTLRPFGLSRDLLNSVSSISCRVANSLSFCTYATSLAPCYSGHSAQ